MSFLGFRFPVYFGLLLLLLGLLPEKHLKKALLLGSWLFYLRAGPESLAVLLALTAVTWLGGRASGRFPKAIPLTLGTEVLILFAFKLRLTLTGAALPTGLSFYLFSSFAYLLDVKRGQTKPEGDFSRLALFTGFFPQMVQGPIRRYAPEKGPAVTKESLVFGGQRMLWGYFKKLVIADRLAPAVTALRGMEGSGSFWLLTALYSVQLYADFTGGMDMALGAAEAMGIRLPENFNHPFLSKSIAEYWRRWHITLGQWMKQYIFYPVSVFRPLTRLARKLRIRHPQLARKLPIYIASIVTWAVTGIWHGLTPNFLLWGLANCAVILISQELAPLYKAARAKFPWMGKRWYGWFQILRTWLLMNLIRALDLFPDPADYFRRLFSPWQGLDKLPLTLSDWTVLALGCGCLIAVSLLQEKHGSARLLLRGKGFWLFFLLALATVLLGCYGIGYDAGSFIYNQF